MINGERKKIDSVLEEVHGGVIVPTELGSRGFLMRPRSSRGKGGMVGRVRKWRSGRRRGDGDIQSDVVEGLVLVGLT